MLIKYKLHWYKGNSLDEYETHKFNSSGRIFNYVRKTWGDNTRKYEMENKVQEAELSHQGESETSTTSWKGCERHCPRNTPKHRKRTHSNFELLS